MGQEGRCGEAVPAQYHRLGDLCRIDHAKGPPAILPRPDTGLFLPLEVLVLKVEAGAGKVAGGADDLGAGPALLLHDLVAEVDVLDGVL